MMFLAVSSLCLLTGLPPSTQDCIRVPTFLPNEQRSGFEPKIQFQRILCPYLVPAWGVYLGKRQKSYVEGFNQGAIYAFEVLEWTYLDKQELLRRQKGKDLGFRMGFLAACEAYLVLQRQRPALGLDGKPAPPSLCAPTKRSGLTDAYWEAVAAVFIPHWGAFTEGQEQEYQKGFRESAARIFKEFKSAPTDFGVRTTFQELASKPPGYQMGFMAALEAYSAYESMSPERRTPGFRPVELLPADSSREVPIVETFGYLRPQTYQLADTSNHTGKTLIELLGAGNIARIVAFTNPGVPKRSEIPLERCKRALFQFKLTDDKVSYTNLSTVKGFIELKDGKTLDWTLNDHFGILEVGELMFFAEPNP